VHFFRTGSTERTPDGKRENSRSFDSSPVVPCVSHPIPITEGFPKTGRHDRIGTIFFYRNVQQPPDERTPYKRASRTDHFFCGFERYFRSNSAMETGGEYT
jgi:hypothetical protein